MWYLSCLFILIVFLSASSVVGAVVCRLLPYRVRPYANFSFTPLLGVAVFVLLATLVGWAGSGFKTWLCLPLTLGIVLISIWRLNSSGAIAGMLVPTSILSLFAIAASSCFLFSILRFEAFNPYNDAYTYLVHSQWLQDHSFRETASLSGNFPATTQVRLYQGLQARMGASFLLGWVQSVFGIEWSYEVYPAVVLLPLISGSYALAGLALFVVKKGRALCLLGASVGALTLNGFSFGPMVGFLPQTFGLAFAFGGLGLLGMDVVSARTFQWRRGVLQLLPTSLLLAAMIFCYPEAAPFIAFAIGLCFVLWAGFKPSRARRLLQVFAAVALSVLVLANAELYRAVSSLLVQMHAVVGGPIVWTPLQFLGHAAGFHSGAWDGDLWLFINPQLSELFVLASIGLAGGALVVNRHKIRIAAMLPAISMLAISIVGIAYFRYVAASPWSEGTGQSWSQFKLTNWASLFLIFLMVCASASTCYGPRWAKVAVAAWLILWQCAAVGMNYELADVRTRSIRQEAGYNKAPFESYKQLRQTLKALSPDSPVYLDLGGVHHKSRQIVTYFLMDQKVASDWTDDGYIATWLPGAEKTQSVYGSTWTVTAVNQSRKLSEQRVGNFSIYKATENPVRLAQAVGGYGDEVEGGSVWRWTRDQVLYKYKLIKSGAVRLRAKYTYLPAPGDRDLKISVVQSAPVVLDSFRMKEGWNQSISRSFEVTQPEFSLLFQCDKAPVQLGPADPRLMSFLIKNLELEIVE